MAKAVESVRTAQKVLMAKAAPRTALVLSPAKKEKMATAEVKETVMVRTAPKVLMAKAAPRTALVLSQARTQKAAIAGMKAGGTVPMARAAPREALGRKNRARVEDKEESSPGRGGDRRVRQGLEDREERGEIEEREERDGDAA